MLFPMGAVFDPQKMTDRFLDLARIYDRGVIGDGDAEALEHVQAESKGDEFQRWRDQAARSRVKPNSRASRKRQAEDRRVDAELAAARAKYGYRSA